MTTTIISGPSGGGVTTTLLNFAIKSMVNGESCLYLTNEDPSQKMQNIAPEQSLKHGIFHSIETVKTFDSMKVMFCIGKFVGAYNKIPKNVYIDSQIDHKCITKLRIELLEVNFVIGIRTNRSRRDDFGVFTSYAQIADNLFWLSPGVDYMTGEKNCVVVKQLKNRFENTKNTFIINFKNDLQSS